MRPTLWSLAGPQVVVMTITCGAMMTSSNGNIFRVTGPLCGEFTGHRWIPHHKGQWRGALMLSLICVWINAWVNNGEACDLRRHRAHYDVIVKAVRNGKVDIMTTLSSQCQMDGHQNAMISSCWICIGLCYIRMVYGESVCMVWLCMYARRYLYIVLSNRSQCKLNGALGLVACFTTPMH